MAIINIFYNAKVKGVTCSALTENYHLNLIPAVSSLAVWLNTFLFWFTLTAVDFRCFQKNPSKNPPAQYQTADRQSLQIAAQTDLSPDSGLWLGLCKKSILVKVWQTCFMLFVLLFSLYMLHEIIQSQTTLLKLTLFIEVLH